MGERIAISDAPLADLGREGVEQNIPIAEKGERGRVAPKRTTFEALVNALSGRIAPPPSQITQYGMANNPETVFELPGGEGPGQTAGTTQASIDPNDKFVISGDEDYYRASQGRVQVTEAGVYRIHAQLNGEYRPDSLVGDWRWRIITTMFIEGQRNVTATDTLVPSGAFPRRNFTVSNNILVARVAAGDQIRILLQAQNVGTEESDPDLFSTIRVLGGFSGFRSNITIERVAD